MKGIGLTVALLLCASFAQAQESAWTLLEKGLAEFKKGRYERAEKMFDAATRSDVRCEDGFFYLGKIKERKGKRREAKVLYLKVTDKAGTYSLAAERLGHLALRAGDKEEAVKYFTIYADDRPSINAYMQLANVQLGAKQYANAEVTLGKASKLSSGNLDIVDMYGRLYMETQEYGKALDAYTTIVKKIPVDNTARFLRGVCLQHLGRGSEAVREWETVLKKDPYHGLTLKSLLSSFEGDPSRSREVKEYRLRLKRLATAKPPTRPVKGG